MEEADSIRVNARRGKITGIDKMAGITYKICENSLDDLQRIKELHRLTRPLKKDEERISVIGLRL